MTHSGTLGEIASVEPATYDTAIFDPRIREFHGCDFFNVGYWAETAEKTADNIPLASRALVGLHLELEAETAFDSAFKVLDVGCGLGATTRMFADRYGVDAVVGGNYSQRQIEYARNANPGVDFRVIDATELPFPDASLDRIHAVEAAFHFEPRTAFLKDAARVLKPRGRLVLTDLLFRRGVGLPRCNSVQSIEDYKNLVEGFGFKCLDLRDIREDTLKPYQVLLANAGYSQMAKALNFVFAYTLGVFERY